MATRHSTLAELSPPANPEQGHLRSPWTTLCFGARKQCEEVLEQERLSARSALPLGSKRRDSRKGPAFWKGWCTNLRTKPMGSVAVFSHRLTKITFVLAVLVLVVHVAILYPTMLLLLENAVRQCA